MKRFLVFGLIGLAILALVALTEHGSSTIGGSQSAPYSAALLSSGQPVSLTSLQGKPA